MCIVVKLLTPAAMVDSDGGQPSGKVNDCSLNWC